MNTQELTLAGVDVQDMLDRFMNNTVLVKMIVGKFMKEQTYAQLKAAIAQGDMKAAEFHCHSLKGVCGNLSLKKLFHLFQEQLRLFRAGEPEKAAAMMEEIGPEYDNALVHLQLWLDQQ